MGEYDLDLLKSSPETLLDDKIIVNRPRKNGKSSESYYTLDNENRIVTQIIKLKVKHQT